MILSDFCKTKILPEIKKPLGSVPTELFNDGFNDLHPLFISAIPIIPDPSHHLFCSSLPFQSSPHPLIPSFHLCHSNHPLTLSSSLFISAIPMIPTPSHLYPLFTFAIPIIPHLSYPDALISIVPVISQARRNSCNIAQESFLFSSKISVNSRQIIYFNQLTLDFF